MTLPTTHTLEEVAASRDCCAGSYGGGFAENSVTLIFRLRC